jgi:hypothetical protein
MICSPFFLRLFVEREGRLAFPTSELTTLASPFVVLVIRIVLVLGDAMLGVAEPKFANAAVATPRKGR